MTGYHCTLIVLGLTVGAAWGFEHTISEGVTPGAPAVTGNGTGQELSGVEGERGSVLRAVQRWFQNSLEKYRLRFTTTTVSRESTSESSAHTHMPLGFTRDPVCNMSAFLKQARLCWKTAAVYSDKPDGICAHKVDAMYRRCLVRVTKQTSCEEDERAQQRIRGEVDSQRAQCVGASFPRAAASPWGFGAPSLGRFILATLLVLAL
ncbi:uncharacterized protein LOC144136226 [Amblyomma americanum]